MAENERCRDFRAALSRALEGRPQPVALAQLAWHEHLLACGECRDLLEREEALEVLLATLPEPKLPPDLTRRVILRLEREAGGLDSLLELDAATAPAGLAGRVEAGVRAELALDRLLERDSVALPAALARRVEAGVRGELALDRLLERDAVEVPEGLTARVLAGLAGEPLAAPRSLAQVPPARRSPRLLRSPLVYAAAAAGLLALFYFGGPTGGGGTAVDELARLEGVGRNEPDPELLAMLDVLERDALWGDTAVGGPVTDGGDLELFLSESVDIDDELLLAYLGEEDGPAGR